MSCNKTKPVPEADKKSALDFPGVAQNIADSDKATPALEKQSVKELNNNPRNTDGPQQ